MKHEVSAKPMLQQSVEAVETLSGDNQPIGQRGAPPSSHTSTQGLRQNMASEEFIPASGTSGNGMSMVLLSRTVTPTILLAYLGSSPTSLKII